MMNNTSDGSRFDMVEFPFLRRYNEIALNSISGPALEMHSTSARAFTILSASQRVINVGEKLLEYGRTVSEF